MSSSPSPPLHHLPRSPNSDAIPTHYIHSDTPETPAPSRHPLNPAGITDTDHRERVLAQLRMWLVLLLFALFWQWGSEFGLFGELPAREQLGYEGRRYGQSRRPADTEFTQSLLQLQQQTEKSSTTGSGKGKLPLQFQFSKHNRSAANSARAAAVKEAMKESFWKYRAAAWGADEVKPISGKRHTSLNGWGVTIVDSLTTLGIMGLEEEFILCVDYILNELDFRVVSGEPPPPEWVKVGYVHFETGEPLSEMGGDNTETGNSLVDPFETTIRYLAALISTVDLIDDNAIPFYVGEEKRDGLLEKAVELAELLAPAFDTPSGMPWPRVDWKRGKGCIEPEWQRPYALWVRNVTVCLARAGTNWVEYASLTRLTGREEFRRNATRAWRPLVWNRFAEPWPGLIDGPWDIMTAQPFDSYRSWGPGHDSFYEYLLKAPLLSPNDPNARTYLTRWLTSAHSLSAHLFLESTPPASSSDPTLPGKRFLHSYHHGYLYNEMSHLACFAAGNLMLGGKYLGDDEIFDVGEELVDSCRELYRRTETGVGAETVRWDVKEPLGPVTWRAGKREEVREREQKGWWVSDARWILRPETVESYFYAYRITGKKVYQDWAWDAFLSITAATTSTHGHASIKNVNAPPGPENQDDRMESFWAAETLKYLWLTFEEEDVLSLEKWVFNTEAHPLKVEVEASDYPAAASTCSTAAEREATTEGNEAVTPTAVEKADPEEGDTKDPESNPPSQPEPQQQQILLRHHQEDPQQQQQQRQEQPPQEQPHITIDLENLGNLKPREVVRIQGLLDMLGLHVTIDGSGNVYYPGDDGYYDYGYYDEAMRGGDWMEEDQEEEEWERRVTALR
ncbi:seven-hairpin glycosidase [Ascodesmis nigricans]|uniref:alpha-1,2-Mannosidase n=1 Tax=Ascodesmis nigricans TaxID=341454 RepID=A0A4S2N0K0_9PEZI|nr:seven-hairpin glycosidase [Ascodesmis nigricans]